MVETQGPVVKAPAPAQVMFKSKALKVGDLVNPSACLSARARAHPPARRSVRLFIRLLGHEVA